MRSGFPTPTEHVSNTAILNSIEAGDIELRFLGGQTRCHQSDANTAE